MSDFAPIHPGEILQSEFLAPLHITPYKLAKATHLDQTRIGQIIKGQRAITASTALRLSRALGTSEMFWVNLQARFLEVDTRRRLLTLGAAPLVGCSR